MVQILASIFGVAFLLSRGALAAPMPDSSINEPGVISPDGTPITLGADPTPVAVNYESPSPQMEETTTMMEQPKATITTAAVDALSTSSPTYNTATISYGSGSSNWGNGYDNCVQQCMNSYGAPPAQYTPPPSTTTPPNDSSGGTGGATHTVIVAPTKGVLRFVPFTVNASVGDTIHYVWGAGPHTVTKSSILEPCNKSSDATFFNSGPLNATATFDQLVNDTDPLFFYCNVPGHCAKGMFGIINAPSAAANPTSVGNMMPALISTNPTLATMLMYTQNKTAGTSAYNWGENIDMASVPEWAQEEVLTNVMYTRLLFAANPGMLENGQGASNPDGSPVTVPGDISQLAADSGTGGSATTSPVGNVGGATQTGSLTSATPSGTSGPSSGVSQNGASSTTSSALLIGVVAIVASLLAM